MEQLELFDTEDEFTSRDRHELSKLSNRREIRCKDGIRP